MKRNLTLNVLCLMFFAVALNAQNQPESYCGYHGKSEWLTQYQQNPDAYLQKRSGTTTYVPLTVHLLGTDGGSGHFAVEQMLDALCTLNEDFVDSELQFYLEDDFNYINNTDWYVHDFRSGRDMMNQNNVAATLNSYFVDDPAGNCGYYTGGADAIAMAKSCSGINDHTFAHEVGHYLSLPHPFVGWEGTTFEGGENAPTVVGGNQVELLDGSNCRNAGDGFCDTRADYLSVRWTCNGNGESNVTLTDPSGETFRADGSPIMSYANDACASRFSVEQGNAMQANLLNRRQNLLKNPTVPGPIGTTVQPATPALDETVPLGDVLIAWEPVENATHYFVEVSYFANFIVTLESGITDTNEFLSTGLTVERPVYWRVRPYNYFEFCASPSDVFSFNLSAASSTRTIEAIESFVVSPIPVGSGNELVVELTTDRSFAVNASLISLTGQVLKTEDQELNVGQQQFTFGLPEVPNGIYLLSLQNENGERMIKRVVVN